MISINQVAKSYGGKELLTGTSLQVTRADRIGLVGPNGAGKSTLIRMLLGQEEPDSGEISIEKRCTIGFLPQETAPVGDELVIELAISIHPELVTLRRKLNQDHHDHHDGPDPHARFTELGGFEIEARAKKFLSGLGFREKDFDRPARELSGGWVMRAHLARLLVQEPDLLLLDEPTNHLDLHSLLWFQEQLQSWPGAILIVSHDREFLNRIVNSIVEIRGGQLIRYSGNYEDYLQQREAHEANLQAAYKNQQKEIARLMLFVDRFRAKNTKAAQAQSKLKQIERMEKIKLPDDQAPEIDFAFPQPRRSGQRVLTLKDVSFSYGNTRVYDHLDFEIERGERLVLVGPNGAGKSTLLKLLAGVLPVQAGERILGHNVISGYYSQNRVEMLRLDRSVLDEALDTGQRVSEQFVRNILGCFLFSGDDVFKPVRVLSGGEKSRLALVKLLLDPPNLLLMDEPTTHLDMASIEALINALTQYEGTLVFISHDVYFIRQLADKVVHVENGRIRRYPGDYGYYLDKSAAENSNLNNGLTSSPRVAAPKPTEKSSLSSRELRRIEAEQRQARSRARKQQESVVRELEEKIATLETRQSEITEELQDPSTYSKGGLAAELNRELLAIEEELQDLHSQWEAEALRLEQL